MRIWQVGFFRLCLVLSFSLKVLAQEPSPASPASADLPAQAAPPASSPQPKSFDEVMDRVIQREHLFLAQMRHLRPMVETYIQDLKPDKDGKNQPTKDQYFLGRLDMSDGPEDTSFVGQAGFGHRMLNRLTGLYAMHFLPLGFAQMVVLDTDFQKKNITTSLLCGENFWEMFVAWLLMFSQKMMLLQGDFRAASGWKIRTITSSALTGLTFPIPRPAIIFILIVGGSTCAPARGSRLTFTAKNRT